MGLDLTVVNFKNVNISYSTVHSLRAFCIYMTCQYLSQHTNHLYDYTLTTSELKTWLENMAAVEQWLKHPESNTCAHVNMNAHIKPAYAKLLCVSELIVLNPLTLGLYLWVNCCDYEGSWPVHFVPIISHWWQWFLHHVSQDLYICNHPELQYYHFLTQEIAELFAHAHKHHLTVDRV
jgi:hypothetical protein